MFSITLHHHFARNKKRIVICIQLKKYQGVYEYRSTTVDVATRQLSVKYRSSKTSYNKRVGEK